MPRAAGRVEAGLVGAVEEPGQRVEVLLADRVVLVVVAARAPDRQPEKRRADRVGPIDGVLDAVLFVDRAVLRRSFADAQERRRQRLLLSRAWLGSRSPASCQVPNWSNGMLRLNAEITQSRYGQNSRSW